MNNSPKPEYLLIENPNDLHRFAKQLENEKETALAIDTEADSMHHYQERICLIQISTSREKVVIDPLKVSGISDLKPVFSNPEVMKIFHGADYDVRSLNRDFGIEICNLFDTEIASRFLGYRETGLEAMVGRKFGVELEKKYQKKDWSVRPLPEEMLEYAVADVAYLIPLATELIRELEATDRLEWVLEECDILKDVRYEPNHVTPLFLRFKGAGGLTRPELAVLEALLQYREKIAQKKDRPVFKVIHNRSLLNIAKHKPEDIKSLENTNALSKKQMKMYGADIVNAVKNALKTPEKEMPKYPRKKFAPLPPRLPERIRALKKSRDRKARRLNIDPSLLCNKALLSKIAAENPDHSKKLSFIENIRDWQIEAFGTEIVNALKQMKK